MSIFYYYYYYTTIYQTRHGNQSKLLINQRHLSRVLDPVISLGIQIENQNFL